MAKSETQKRIEEMNAKFKEVTAQYVKDFDGTKEDIEKAEKKFYNQFKFNELKLK